MSQRTAAPPSAGEPPPIQIRLLAYPDLPQVIAVERRVFPTPWSLAMFVLELSKQSGVCLAAFSGDRDRDSQWKCEPCPNQRLEASPSHSFFPFEWEQQLVGWRVPSSRGRL